MEAHGNGSNSSHINGHEYTSISHQEGVNNDDEIRNHIKSNDIVTASETTDVPTLVPPAAPTKPQLRRRLFEKLRTKRRQMITQHHHQFDTTNATLEEENDGNLTSSGNVKAVMKKQSLVTHYYRVDTVPRKTLQLPRKKYNKNNNNATTSAATFVVENEPPIHDTNTTSNTTGTTTTSALRHSPLSIMNHNKKRRNHPPHIEKVVNVILPGVPSYEEDWARDTHDYFNLIILVPVTVLNIMNWNWDILLSLGNYNNNNHHHHRNNHNNDNIGYMEYIEQMVDTLQSAWTGDWFDIFFYFTAAYFIIDLLWIIILPICVKSPSTIIQHHIAVLLYIMIPYIHPHVRFCMGACMSVEINTWFLIARRVFNKQGFPPWTLIELNSWLSIRVKVISIFFYLTWISIRCILYPGLLIPFYKFSRDHTKQTGTVFHLISAACVLHAAFCLLNLKWSYELLMSKIRYFRRQYVQRKQQLRYDRNHPQNHNSSGDKLSSSSHRYQQDPSISEGL